MTYYHFTAGTLRNGDPIPKIGKWIEVKPPLVLCDHPGLHFSKRVLDALTYAPGPMLHKVEIGGEVLWGDDKGCAQKRKIIASIDATDILRQFARMCALDVIDNWNQPVPDVVLEWLKTGDESLQGAALSAAHSAASAAWSASATWSAAGSAAWSAAAWAAGSAAKSAAGRWAAKSAAQSAAYSAAHSAARAADRWAAYSAAKTRQNRRLAQMVAKEFNK